MAGRNAKQKGDEVRDGERKGKDYELIAKQVTQMEKGIEENANRWREMVKEIKGLKEALSEKIGKESEGDNGKMGLNRKFEQMSIKVTGLSETIEDLQKTNDGLNEQNKTLKQRVQEIVKENESLRERLTINERKGREQGDFLVKMQNVQNGWERVQKERTVDFKEIMKQQEEEHKNNLERNIIQVIRNKENVVVDMIDKRRSVIIFGLKEKIVNNRSERREEELKVAREIVQEVEGDNPEAVEEIEELRRLGKYEEGKVRPMRIKFKNQVAATRVLERTWRLAQKEKYREVWIRKDLNEEERASMNELVKEAKAKNEQRSEEERNRFYWRVVEGKMKKWYVKRK